MFEKKKRHKHGATETQTCVTLDLDLLGRLISYIVLVHSATWNFKSFRIFNSLRFQKILKTSNFGSKLLKILMQADKIVKSAQWRKLFAMFRCLLLNPNRAKATCS